MNDRVSTPHGGLAALPPHAPEGLGEARSEMRKKAAWQPLDMLAFVGALIDEGLRRGRALVTHVETARTRPEVLDDALADRVIEFFDEESDLVVFFEAQVARWMLEAHTTAQGHELVRLQHVLAQTREVVRTLQALLQELHQIVGVRGA